jgi:hypothetical protein
LRSCPLCGQDLSNLPAPQRVYVLGPAVAPPPAAVPVESKPVETAAKPSITPSPEANAVPKPAKKAKRTTKKKK